MPLTSSLLVSCGTAGDLAVSAFVDKEVAVFDPHHRQLIKCWLNRHIVSGHQQCLADLEVAICRLIDQALCTDDAKWHLRFTNGLQLFSENDTSIRRLCRSVSFSQKLVDYFSFAINKLVVTTTTTTSAARSASGGSRGEGGGGLAYLEAKLLLKLVQIFSRIISGNKIAQHQVNDNYRSVQIPNTLIDSVWLMAVSDSYELDAKFSAVNLIIQLDTQPDYLHFYNRCTDLVTTVVPNERQEAALLCIRILGIGAYSNQVATEKLVSVLNNKPLLIVLFTSLAKCCLTRMPTSLAIAFYRSLHCLTKSAVATCSLKTANTIIWSNNKVTTPLFKVYVELLESGWNNRAEIVRDLASQVFETLLLLFKHTRSFSSSSPNGKDTFLEDLVCTLLKTDWQSRLKYRPLSQIAELFGPDIIDGCASQVGISIPEKLSTAFSDRSISPHAGIFTAGIVDAAVGHSVVSFNEAEFLLNLVVSVVKVANYDPNATRHFVTFAIPKLLKVRGRSFADVIIRRATSDDKSQLLSDADFLILFSVCRSSRSTGLLDLSENEDDPQLNKLLHQALNHSNIYVCFSCFILAKVQVQKFSSVKYFTSEQIRLEAFGFLCEHIKSSQPFIDWELGAIERFIISSFKVDSSDFRQAYSSLLRKCFVRLRESAPKSTDSGSSQLYTSFLRCIIGSCLQSLAFRGSAFSRRTISLSLLSELTNVFLWSGGSSAGALGWSVLPSVLKEVYPNSKEILLNLLARETYEENKKLAIVILTTYWSDFGCIYESACKLSQSTYPQNSVTAAYLFMLHSNRLQSEEIIDTVLKTLTTSLDKQVEVARQDLTEAATSRPIYPTILCIRYTINDRRRQLLNKVSLEKFRNFCLVLIDSLRSVADVVSPVISHQSPEGIITPGDDNSEATTADDPLDLTSEFLTVCCWRSIKEVFLTLSLLVELSLDDGDVLKVDEIKAIGDFFSDMLLKARHRGAFEIAYAGFDKICARLWQCGSSELNQLPAMWLQPLLSSFESTGENVALSSTRRSAGLPFYFQAVVANEPRITHSVSVSMLESTLNLLVERSVQTDCDPSVRVHALNILRALIRDARLEQAVTPFVGEAFIAAMTALSSEHWSLRNSGTLLFAALISRVFGVHRDKFTPAKKNTMTGRLFFALYPDLFKFLLDFFSPDSPVMSRNNSTTSSAAVSFLSLFEHLYPSPFDVNETTIPSESENVNNGQEATARTGSNTKINVFAFIPALLTLLGHRSVRIRIMSSRSIRNFVTLDSLPVLLENLIDRYNGMSNKEANFTDGCFILLRELAVLFASDADSLQLITEVALLLVDWITNYRPNTNSLITASMLSFLLKAAEITAIPAMNGAGLLETTEKLSNLVISSHNYANCAETPSTLVIRAVQCAILCITRKGNSDVITSYLRHKNKFVRCATIDCLNKMLFSKLGNSNKNVSLFEDTIDRDEEFTDITVKNEDSWRILQHLINTGSLACLARQQLTALNVDRNIPETSKLLNLMAFCILVISDQKIQSEFSTKMAQEMFEKCKFILKNYGLSSELSMACFRALFALSSFLTAVDHDVIAALLASALVTDCDDVAKFRLAVFGLSRLPRRLVLLNDDICDVVLTLLTSSEPHIRTLTSWYVTHSLLESKTHSLHSGQALVVFICLVAATRPAVSAAGWLLDIATTPRGTLTTADEDKKAVFEAEETNPFAEDRLLSNVSIFVLSLLINGLSKTLDVIFPGLHLPTPLLDNLKNCFSTYKCDIDTDLLVCIKSKLLFAKCDHLKTVDDVGNEILSCLGKKEFAETLFKQRHPLMPSSDIIHQQLLFSKVLNSNITNTSLLATAEQLQAFNQTEDDERLFLSDEYIAAVNFNAVVII